MLTEDVLAACRAVREGLGPSFTEAVYHHALEVELRSRGLPYESEKVVPVEYKGHAVGAVRLDVLVDKRLVVELKATSRLQDCHSEQAAKYMRLIGAEDALVVNFTGTAFSHRHITGKR